MSYDAAARHPLAVLALAALVLGTLAAGMPRLRPEADFVDTVPASPEVEAYRRMTDRLEGVRFVVVHMPFDGASGLGNLRTDAGFDALVREQADLTRAVTQALPAGAVAHTLSAHEAMRQANYMLAKVATAGNPPESSYSVPSDPVTYREVRDRARAASSDVLAADGSSALLLVFLRADDAAEARELAGLVETAVARWAENASTPATSEPSASGFLSSSRYVDERNRSDLRVWGLVSLGAVAAVLLVVVRRPTNILVASLSLAAATAATFGLAGWSGLRIHFLTVFLAPVVAGIGMDYALHLLHAQERHLAAGHPHRDALARALRDVGPALLAGAGTTVAGLLVLSLVPAPIFSQVGWLSAVAVTLGFTASLTLAPALRALLPPRPRPVRRDRIGGAFAAAGAWSLRHPALVAVLLVGLTAGAAATAAAATRVESGSIENELPAGDPVRALQQRLEAEYGAFQRAYLVVEGDLADAKALRALDGAVRRAAALPLYREASAVTDLLRADAATDEGVVDIVLAPARTGDGLPTTDAEARHALARLWADPLWRTLAPFVATRDATLAVVAVQLDPWEDQAELRHLRDALTAEADRLREELGPAYAVRAAGAPVNRAAVVEQTAPDVTLSTLGVAAAVGAVLTVAWARSWRGLLAAAGTVAAVLMASLLLLASVPALDWAYQAADTGNRAALTEMFLLAFAITTCVGVDGIIQVVHRARSVGVAQALRDTGRPVTNTSLTTVAAFAPLAGLYFLQSKNLAILVALGATYAYVLTVLVAPWLARLVAPRPAPAP